MSNPGVITLSESTSSKGMLRRIVVEDNIGESIHIHIDELRIDMGIRELISLSEDIEKIHLGLLDFDSSLIKKLDKSTLLGLASNLPNLKSIDIVEKDISELSFLVWKSCRLGLRWPKQVNVKKTPAYKYLADLSDEFVNYQQDSVPGESNVVRLERLKLSIERHSFNPDRFRYGVLVGSQDLIRDGQHRFAILAHIGVESQRVRLARMTFKNRRSSVSVIKLRSAALINSAKQVLKGVKYLLLSNQT